MSHRKLPFLFIFCDLLTSQQIIKYFVCENMQLHGARSELSISLLTLCLLFVGFFSKIVGVPSSEKIVLEVAQRRRALVASN